MKLLIYFFITVSVFAQDSLRIASLTEKVSNVKKDINLGFEKYHEISFGTKPLVSIPVNRNWAKSSLIYDQILNINYRASTVLNFPKKKESFIDSDLFFIVVGSAVAFGTAAVYFKFESDKYYEQYQQTNDKIYLNKSLFNKSSFSLFGTINIS